MENLKSDIIDNFYKRVTKTQDCWRWNGAKLNTGHGNLRVNGKHILDIDYLGLLQTENNLKI